MKQKNMTRTSLILSLVFSFFFFSAVQAVTIFAQKSNEPLGVDNIHLIKVFVDTQGKEINALDGNLEIIGPAKIEFVKLGGSIFSLWPIKPSVEKNQITFTGGTPSGVFGQSLKIFEIAIRPTQIGNISIRTKSATAYLNDGQGTPAPVSLSASDFNVSEVAGAAQNDLEKMILTDKTPPENFKIDLGYDELSFGKKYFISFNAFDSDSGLNRYEIKEGSLPIVRSGNTYVLQDQTLKSKISVRAIDNAGNIRIVSMDAPKGFPWKMLVYSIFGLIILAGIALAYIIYRKKHNV